ncbi:MAG: adenylate/guanylate cyclase domain-containing protein [Armatimonadota bacterium]|nr:adenylate/guanylate cyclase domain-containing protein [Armatimonadota bacterium]
MIPHPTGTVTFLFTDIEGSTRLWEQHPDAMQAVLARHDAILRRTIAGRQGYVFKTVGDAFHAAFARARDAVAAALALQRALAAEAWPSEVGTIRVRAALHTGTAELRNGDYFGPALNRVARLLAAGHGGQTLLTLATQELVRDALPEHASLVDLGRHRLKDLSRPEHIYQLAAFGLPAQFPPLRTLDARLTNLPPQSTLLVGREREVAAVLELLRRPGVRLVTLTGPGGTGKTRLSLQVAADLLDEYDDGVWFVELASVGDPDMVVPAIAGALNLKDSSDQRLVDTLKAHLRDLRTLLVLDNFEQVVGVAPVLVDLLRAAPRITILVTSREVLRVAGEHDYPVPPLELPDARRRQTAAELSGYGAVALFVQRAKAARPDFEMTDRNGATIAEICARLDGLPLAIELAAARSRVLTPQAMLERLASRLDALTGRARDLPGRQQTMRGAIAWSYDLLDEEEQRLFWRLGAFVGGWTLDAAEEVCAEGLPLDTLNGLELLLDKSLIRHADAGTPRFSMLGVIREFAAEKLAQSGEAEAIRDRHLGYVMTLTRRAGSEVDGAREAEWRARVREERDNVRAAVGWALASDKMETVVQIASDVWPYWEMFGWQDEVHAWMVRATSAELPPASRAAALRLQGLATSDPAERKMCWEAALVLYREMNDLEGIRRCLNNLGLLARNAGDYATADALLQETLHMAQAAGGVLLVLPLANLALNALFRSDFAAAEAYLDQHQTVAQAAGSAPHLAENKRLRGYVALRQGQNPLARRLLQDALGMARAEDDAPLVARCRVHLGYLALREGSLAEAHARLADGLRGFHEVGAGEGVQLALRGLAALAATRRLAERAARLFAAAEALRERLGIVLPPVERSEYEEYVAAVRAGTSDRGFATAWAEGRAMSLDQAVTLALE